MKILTCPQCQSQFDVATMQPGASFVCGKCRNVLNVPAAAPVVRPVVQPGAGARPRAATPAAPASPPATVALSGEEMQRALAAARAGSDAPAAQAARKLPPAMEARRQQQAASAPTRAGTGSQPGAPAARQAAPAQRQAAPAARQAAAPAQRQAAAAAPAAAAPARGGGAPSRAAATAAPAAAAARPERASRRSRRGGGGDDAGEAGDDAPAPKSKTPLYAGIGVGAVVVVAALVMMSKNSDDADQQAQTAADAQKQPEPEPANLDEWQKFLRMPAAEQLAFVATQRQEAQTANDVTKMKALFDWFSDARVSSLKLAADTRSQVADDALRVDPNCDWANLSKGRKNLLEILTQARQDYAKAFSYPDRDEAAFDKLLEDTQKEPWADGRKFADAQALIERIAKRHADFEANPRLAQALDKQTAWVKGNPLFKDFKFEVRFADPYVISQQYEEFTDPDEAHKNKDRLEKVKTIANRDAIIFQELNRHFRDLLAERFKLPTLAEKNRILFAVITWNNEAFIELHRKANNGDAPSPWIRAFYSPPEQKIFHYIGDDSLRAQDEVPVAHGRIQKTSDQVTFHEGTHQLQHEYGAIYRGKPLVDGDKNVPPRKAMWFDEGFAEFMGSVEVDADKAGDLVGAKFHHNRLLLERIAQVRGDGRTRTYREQARKWTIAEMILPNHNGELLTRSEQLLPGQGVYMANLFYARAWGFVHFLWFYDNGKYRPQFLDYMEKVFKEEHGPEAFAKAMGRKNAKDWDGMEQEFEWYWNECLARRIGWKDDGRTKPFNTETDPPAGKYDPDAEKDDLDDEPDDEPNDDKEKGK